MVPTVGVSQDEEPRGLANEAFIDTITQASSQLKSQD